MADHDLRRAIYGLSDARCTVCVRCGSLWWCPNPPAGGQGLVPTECKGLLTGDLRLTAGLAWVEGVPDEILDATNARLIEFGMGMKVAEFRALAAEHGLTLSKVDESSPSLSDDSE